MDKVGDVQDDTAYIHVCAIFEVSCIDTVTIITIIFFTKIATDRKIKVPLPFLTC